MMASKIYEFSNASHTIYNEQTNTKDTSHSRQTQATATATLLDDPSTVGHVLLQIAIGAAIIVVVMVWMICAFGSRVSGIPCHRPDPVTANDVGGVHEAGHYGAPCSRRWCTNSHVVRLR